MPESQYKRVRDQCLAQKTLFEDPDFPAVNRSIYYSKLDKSIVWKRPYVSNYVIGICLLCTRTSLSFAQRLYMQYLLYKVSYMMVHLRTC